MKITGWVNARPSGQERIRIGLPFEELAKHGYETSFGRTWGEVREADVIVGCQIALPEASVPWTRTCGVPGGPFMVFETDDDYLGLPPYNPAHREWSNKDQRFGYIASMRVSHRIVTSTDALANLLYDQTGHPDIVVARNTVPSSMLQVPKPQNERLTIGWAGGTSHKGDWEWCRDGVRKAMAQLKLVKLRFIGADYRSTIRLPSHQMEHVPWTTNVDAYWHGEALGVDIFLAPLMPSAFNRYKSEIKLIEAGARGIPVIAARHGIYAQHVQDAAPQAHAVHQESRSA